MKRKELTCDLCNEPCGHAFAVYGEITDSGPQVILCLACDALEQEYGINLDESADESLTAVR